ncbi:Gfo/Idh/MocA family protein [Actinomadura chibensis]|uniref:Gfo/Idh/MocA family protein n=1 Tax=Actinomadura chibensis TaxID=392828 RepID=UPI000831C246|nr:Gfo/Idh/MocA family oxidoreductase [Actinomadura chibensis]
MTELRLGLVGAGAVGALHVEAAQRVPGVRVASVCDLDPVAARRLAAPLDARAYTDHRDLIASGGVDAVLVNTPHAVHTAIVCDAAAAGLHVLVEKPMATSLADCDAMIAACAEARVRLAVGHVQRFLPDKAAAKAALDAGEIGEPVLVSDRRGSDYRAGSRPSWFLDPRVAGGGVFINIGAHCVDRLLWLTGRRVEQVDGRLKNTPIETDVLVRLDLTGGLTAHIAVTSTGPAAPHDEMTVVGETGTLSISPHTGTALHKDGTTAWLHRPGPEDIPAAFAAQLADFAAAVAEDREPAVGGPHGRRVLEIILATYSSARRRGPVQVSGRRPPWPAATHPAPTSCSS